MLTLTKDAVTLYDIETDTVWEVMTVAEGESALRISRELGDTVQEYETTDRDGNPLRVVFQVDAVRLYSSPDQGGVYEFVI